MRAAGLFAVALAVAVPSVAQQAERGTQQAPSPDVTMEEVVRNFEDLIMASSPAAEARAEDRAARRWSDVSPAHIADRAARARLIQRQLADVSGEAGPERAILSHLLDQIVMEETFDTARIPFTGDWGFHAEPFFTAGDVRIRTEEDAEAWIARLNDVPRYFTDNITNMRRGIRTGWTAHGDPLKTMTNQVRGQIVGKADDSVLWEPFEALPDHLGEEKKAAIQAAGAKAVMRAVGAYRNLLTYLEEDYAAHARQAPGIVTLPGGDRYYEAAIRAHTAGAGYSPEEIHRLGQQEVARIRAEMETIMAETDYPGSFSDFLSFLRSDPQFYAESPEDLLEKAALISKRLDAILPAYFGKLPRLTYGVEAVPASIAPGYTTGRYSGGDPEEGIAGTYLVNTYALDQRPLYELPALSAHEAVPGHHLQIALAQELEDVPRFRRNYYATAFGEGWGLYAETLAREAGIYRTPYERFGALSYQMWRACRLVADTGMHWYGWSRAEASQCFTENSALAPLNIETEITRYIGWPGQATAYKIGELKILELRSRAQEALGTAFDIRDFHDEVLGAGSLPLHALDRRIDGWIIRQLEAQPAAAGATAP